MKYWQKHIEKPSSKLMVDVIRADVALAAAGCGGCWTGEVRNALQKLPVVNASSAGVAARKGSHVDATNKLGRGRCVIGWWTAIMPFGNDLLTFDGVESPRAEAVDHRKFVSC